MTAAGAVENIDGAAVLPKAGTAGVAAVGMKENEGAVVAAANGFADIPFRSRVWVLCPVKKEKKKTQLLLPEWPMVKYNGTTQRNRMDGRVPQ